MKHTRRMKITKVQRQSVRLPAPGTLRQTGVQPPLVCAHCPVCEQEVETLTKAQAKEVLEIDNQTLNQFIAAGRVHVMRTVSGNFRICKDSLFITVPPAKHAEYTKGKN